MKKETNRFKICLLIPSLQSGGMERVMSELANYFSQQDNVEVSLLLYGSNRDIFYKLNDKVKVYKPNWSFNLKRRITFTFKTISFIRKTVKQIKPDTILSFGEPWNNFVLLALMATGYPVYISERSQPQKKLAVTQQILRKFLYPFSKGLILQTKQANQIYSSSFVSLNKIIIGNPIRAIIPQVEIQKRENWILMVGRFLPTKHHERLIKTFAKINPGGWNLVLVGDDVPNKNVMQQCRQLAKDLKVADKIIFTGNQQDVDQYYLRSKIFAFTSSSEGFPNVVGEAMAGGLAVISYDCNAGPSDLVVPGKSGFLVPVFDDDEFEKYLRLLINNEELIAEMGACAKREINKFSIKQVCSKYLEFISQHMNRT